MQYFSSLFQRALHVGWLCGNTLGTAAQTSVITTWLYVCSFSFWAGEHVKMLGE